MTSSLRKSVHRRNHKERSQPQHRQRLGILEKHADYVKRARDYHSKQDRINTLRVKASERNKDEFYFSMSKERTKGGVHIKDRGNAAIPTDIVKVLKTQDENYIRTMRASNQKKIDKLKIQVMTSVDIRNPDSLEDEERDILIQAEILPSKPTKSAKRAKVPGHILFAESLEEAQELQNPSTKVELASPSTSPSNQVTDLGWKLSKSSRKQAVALPSLDDSDNDEGQDPLEEGTSQRRARLLKELSARLTRDQQLRYAEREFLMQRALMGKGAREKIASPERPESDEDSDEDMDPSRSAGKAKIAGVGEIYKPRVYKWKQERRK